jgi:hypothetical protein
MKILRLISIPLLFIIMNGCDWNVPCSVSGNGNIVTEERHVSGFNGLSVSTGIDVYIAPGDEETLKVVTDENLLEVLKTEVRGNTLKIYFAESVCGTKSSKVYVRYSDIGSISVSSAGNLKGDGILVTDELNIELSSAGNLELNVEAEKIYVDISSSGKAFLSGRTEYLEAGLSSAGHLNAFELEAETGDVSVSSAGNAKVFITGEASFESSSAGNIIYRGDPEIRKKSSSSAGSIRKSNY